MPLIKRYYVARIVVTRVEKTMISIPNNNRDRDQVAEASRETVEIAQLVFNAPTPEELADKISAHVALITDGEVDQ